MAGIEESKPSERLASTNASKARGEGGGSRKAFWIAAIAILPLLVLIGFMALKARKIGVEVAVARSPSGIEAITVLNANGYIFPRRRATVSAKISAQVKELLVEEGTRVRKGQVVARLDDADARAAYDAAKADCAVAKATIPHLQAKLAESERTFGRIRALAESESVSAQEVERAQAAVEGLRAQLRMGQEQVQASAALIQVAALKIENCEVRAPFSGVVVSKDAQPGEVVSPATAADAGIVTIVDMDSLEIEVEVSEEYIPKVSPGQKVEATIDAYPNWRIPGRVRTVIPAADREKATVKVRIAIDAFDPRVLPDLGVKVAFLSKEPGSWEAQAGTLIPREALREVNGKTVVFVFKEGRLEQREVKPGQVRAGEVEIIDGISSGEQVVTAGPRGLKDGDKAEAEF